MSKYSEAGKGSSRRNEDAEKIRNNWDLIFGKKTKEEPMGKPLKEEPLKEQEND